MKSKKAVFFSTDALVALVILFIAILVAYPIMQETTFQEDNSADVLGLLSSLKISGIDSDYARQLISEGKVLNLNSSILEQIGEFYSQGMPEAELLAEEILLELDSPRNIGIWYGSELLASKNSSPYEEAKNVKVAKQTISGIEKGKASKGYVAKAWLQNINEKETSIFVKGDAICGGWTSYSWGDYCGSTENSIYYLVDVPVGAVISNAEWLVEGSWVGQYSKLYVNNVKIFEGTISYYRTFDIKNYLHEGRNILKFYSTSGGDDGATHIIVNYDTSEMQTFEYQRIFPFNEVSSNSVLHYEKSIFLPGEIYAMNVSLNSTKDVNLSIRKGNETISMGKKSPINGNVFFSDSEISSKLALLGIDYSDLNEEYFFLIIELGSSGSVILGADSYVTIDSSETTLPYGAIDITKEIPIYSYSTYLQNTFYRNLVWKFFLPSGAEPIFADWQFGWLHTGGGVSSQIAYANMENLYHSPPDDFLAAFSRFGYTPALSSGVFQEGENNFSLNFGEGYGVSYEASYGYLTYLIKSYINYGLAFEKAKGGTRTIEFEDGSSTDVFIGDRLDSWDPDNDAIDDAVERLLEQLDSNGNGKIDLLIDETSMDIDALDIAGVPYIWSTEVQIRSWD